MEIIKYFVLKDNKNAIKHNLWEAAKGMLTRKLTAWMLTHENKKGLKFKTELFILYSYKKKSKLNPHKKK